MIHPPFSLVEHNWKDSTLYDAEKRIICKFDLVQFSPVHLNERNQESLEEEFSENYLYILKAANTNSIYTEALRAIAGANETMHNFKQLQRVAKDALREAGEVVE